MGISCKQLHMFYHFYVANKAESQRQALILTFMNLFVILFFNLLKATQYLRSTHLHEVTILYIMTSCCANFEL